MILKESVLQEVNSFLINTGYYLVDIIITPDNKITVEIDAFDGVSIDFCVRLNNHLESRLSPEIEEYELEVCSAGITQPFKVLNQYHKNIGNEVEVVAKSGLKYSGILKQVTEEFFVIEIEKRIKAENSKKKINITEELKFAYTEIKTTKYILRFR